MYHFFPTFFFFLFLPFGNFCFKKNTGKQNISSDYKILSSFRVMIQVNDCQSFSLNFPSDATFQFLASKVQSDRNHKCQIGATEILPCALITKVCVSQLSTKMNIRHLSLYSHKLAQQLKTHQKNKDTENGPLGFITSAFQSLKERLRFISPPKNSTHPTLN